MRVSTRGRYGIMAMMCIAARPADQAVPLREIAETLDLSDKYLEQLLSTLRTKGFLRSTKGARGGYTLARPAEDITAAELLNAVEGRLSLVERDNAPESVRQTLDRLLWLPMEAAIWNTAVELTLRGITDEWMRQNQVPMYYI